MSDTFKNALERSGMVDTRRNSLAYAVSQLHHSLSQLDNHHLSIMARDFPAILEAGRVYAGHESGLNRFEIDGVTD
tara:strand:+ start:289 stop:516 length:228 start_codon:yes stop_codon:yes gene_type:complete